MVIITQLLVLNIILYCQIYIRFFSGKSGRNICSQPYELWRPTPHHGIWYFSYLIFFLYSPSSSFLRKKCIFHLSSMINNLCFRWQSLSHYGFRWQFLQNYPLATFCDNFAVMKTLASLASWLLSSLWKSGSIMIKMVT